MSPIDEIVREGARRMLAAALEAEVVAYIDAHAHERDEDGRRLVVRNGHAVPRQVVTFAGAVEVRAPRVNDKPVDELTGERRSVQVGDRACVVPKVAEGDRGAAAVVPASLIQQGLRARAGALPRARTRAFRRRRSPA